jgi:hypothetical protein
MMPSHQKENIRKSSPSRKGQEKEMALLEASKPGSQGRRSLPVRDEVGGNGKRTPNSLYLLLVHWPNPASEERRPNDTIHGVTLEQGTEPAQDRAGEKAEDTQFRHLKWKRGSFFLSRC